MREMLSRLFANRYAGFWLFAEPLMFVSVMVLIRTFIQVLDDIAGTPMIPWMIIGLTAFFLFRDGMTRTMSAVDANRALFAYRQVKPIDTVLIRGVVEAVIHMSVIVLFIVLLAFLGFDMQPHNVIGALFAWFSIWLLGLAAGLILSVITTIIPELSKIVTVMSLPLMILSGAIFPLQFLPYSAQQFLLLNPVAHGIEFLRLNYFAGYWTLDGISIAYLYAWVLPMVALGFMLHLRFEKKMKAK